MQKTAAIGTANSKDNGFLQCILLANGDLAVFK
jgi:hypothetical protein